MGLPLQITFRRTEPSVALEARIRKLASRLEKFSGQIKRCHIVVEPLSHHQQQGALFHIRISISLPDHEISIRRAHPLDPSHADAYVALRDAFRAARRKLEDYERKRRNDVKTPVEPAHGRICELDSERNFGRIETAGGRLIYFHRNSVIDFDFEELTTGTEVRFVEEAGDAGPQASTVQVI
jgi:cold shock CspA family protein/ribosome-associated translation inhibitor RaiA